MPDLSRPQPYAPPSPVIDLDELEYEIARRDFKEFLKYVRIQDTDPFSGKVEMPFVLWPHLEVMTDTLLANRMVIVLKARQIGITWLIVAYMYWLAAYHEGVVALVVSKGELEAKEVISRIDFIHMRLPDGLRGDGKGTTEVWEFTNESSVRALSSSSSAGRSFTASLIFHDEADFHPDLEAGISASRPSIDGGGQHIVVSTANPDNGPDSAFKKRYLRAKTGKGGYTSLFMGWDVRPDRTQAWRDAVVADYEEDLRKKEYPETEAEALSPPSSLAGIPHEVLDQMRERCRPVLQRQEGQPPDARIFIRFRPGNTYTAFTDTSHGVNGDFAVTVVLECNSETVVADIFSATIEPHELAYQSVRLLEMYDSPLWGIEDNDWGIRVIDKAQEMRYRNLYHRPLSHTDPSPGRVGWTTNRATRPLLISELREACLDQHLTVCAEDGLRQFYDLERKTSGAEEGKIAAVEGRHDDYPIAVGGALMMKKMGRPRASKAMVVDEGGVLSVKRLFGRGKEKAPVGRRW